MLSPLGNRFGIPGVISVIALVFAMLGGAYAASSSEGGGGATASATGPRGKPGKPGKPGKTGPAGPTGLAGPAGPKGDAGAPGAPGAPGKSVISKAELAGINCEEGGSNFEVEGSGKKTFACNGLEGLEGPKGSKGDPWTPESELPAGATETGGWAANGGGEDAFTSISFTVELGEELDASKVNFVTFPEQALEENPDCLGSLTVPIAAPEELCVYEGFLSGVPAPKILTLNAGNAGASKSGALLKFEPTAAWFGYGSWAVSAPAPTP